MNNDKKELDARSPENLAARANDFGLTSLSCNQRYHAHKERMAHAALLLQIAIFGWIMGTKNWPFSWIPELTVQVPPGLIAFIGIFVLWLGIHIYVRWQLRRRRSVAFFEHALRITLTRWLSRPPTEQDLRPSPEVTRKESRRTLILDHLFPCRQAPVVYPYEKQAYPKAIFEEWENQANRPTGALVSEWLICVGSVLMFLIIVLRTFVGDGL